MMKLSQSRFICIWVFILGYVLLAAIPAASITAPMQEDVLLKALKDELDRSVEKLQLKDMEKPYYIEYAVEDIEMFNIKSVFGAVVNSNRRQSRMLRVEVRIGSYNLDNTGFVGQSYMYSMMRPPRQLVLEDDYIALRHDLWLATDRAYKQALVQFSQKKSFIKTKVQTEEIPDFSLEEVTKAIDPKKPLKFDQSKWQELVCNLSGIFKEFPAIYDSSVSLNVKIAHKYFVNSEGTESLQPAAIVSLYARASTQAPDGMRLKHFVPFFGIDLEQFPSEKEMAVKVQKMAEELTSLTKAPVLEKYIGPVLVMGQAASELFAQVLAPQLSGERPLLMEQQRMAAMDTQSKLVSRLNRRVLPSFINVVDDPTQKTLNKRQLIGSYKVDDQGVLARSVKLIERGFLRTLLMSRRPRKEILHSNGHGRYAQFGSPSANIGNLFVQTTEGKSFADLKQELIELCRKQDLSYGLIIRKLDNPSITSVDPSMMRREIRRDSVTAPILVYKVSVEDGQEELVRGVVVEEVSVRTLKEIMAAGSEYHINNRLTTGGGIIGFAFPFSLNFAAGIPTTVVAPSVLFEELELKKPSGPQQKPAFLKHPFFKK